MASSIGATTAFSWWRRLCARLPWCRLAPDASNSETSSGPRCDDPTSAVATVWPRARRHAPTPLCSWRSSDVCAALRAYPFSATCATCATSEPAGVYPARENASIVGVQAVGEEGVSHVHVVRHEVLFVALGRDLSRKGHAVDRETAARLDTCGSSLLNTTVSTAKPSHSAAK